MDITAMVTAGVDITDVIIMTDVTIVIAGMADITITIVAEGITDTAEPSRLIGQGVYGIEQESFAAKTTGYGLPCMEALIDKEVKGRLMQINF